MRVEKSPSTLTRSQRSSQLQFCGINLMNMKKILALLLLSVWICGSASVVRAQGEQGSSSAAQHEEESPVRTIARWANFILLFGGLAFLLRKPMSEFFTTRRAEIAGGLKRAEDAQTSAQARMDEIEK